MPVITEAAKRIALRFAKNFATRSAQKAGEDKDGNSSFLRGIALILISLLILSTVLVSGTPSLVWNNMFHTNIKVSPLETMKEELKKNGATMEKKEEEYAKLVLSELSSAHGDVYGEIKAKCDAEGVDYDLSIGNLIESVDFLSSTANPTSPSYHREQAVYMRLKALGFKPQASVYLSSVSKMLTGCKPTFEDVGYTDESREGYGAFALSKIQYKNWMVNIKKCGDSEDKMLKLENQAEYLVYYLKNKLSRQDIYNLSLKEYMKAFDNDILDEKTLKITSDNFMLRHQINIADESDASKDSEAANKAETSANKSEVIGILSEVKSKRGYPPEVTRLKAGILIQYEKKKALVDDWYKFLTSNGFSEIAAAGFLGNAYRESGWVSGSEEIDGGAIGFFQWDGERKKKLKKFANSKGKSWTDAKIQQEFFLKDVKKQFSGDNANLVKNYAPVPFYRTDGYASLSEMKKSKDPIRAFMSVMGQFERPSVYYGRNSANKGYAASEIVLEKCEGAQAQPDYSYAGAGTRQMALILSAFSVKEEQLFEKSYQNEERVKQELRKAIKDNKGALFTLSFGDIKTDSRTGKRYYSLIEIQPASAEQILKEVFELDPLTKYKNGAKKTTILEATTTLADTHMELLYGNHDMGKGSGKSMYYQAGSIGNPLGAKKITHSMITSYFGPRPSPGAGIGSSNHSGIDIAYAGCNGARLYAAMTGTARVYNHGAGYGYHVIIESNNMTMVYGHMISGSSPIRSGQKVQAGEFIGKLGNTGDSTGPHLHFEIRVNGKASDPCPYLGLGESKSNF